MLYHQMLREKEVLDQREKNILERLQTYPAGKLIYSQNGKQRCTRGYKRYKETSGLIEWKDCQIFHSIFT